MHVRMCFLLSASHKLCNELHSAINQKEQERDGGCEREGEAGGAI